MDNSRTDEVPSSAGEAVGYVPPDGYVLAGGVLTRIADKHPLLEKDGRQWLEVAGEIVPHHEGSLPVVGKDGRVEKTSRLPHYERIQDGRLFVSTSGHTRVRWQPLVTADNREGMIGLAKTLYERFFKNAEPDTKPEKQFRHLRSKCEKTRDPAEKIAAAKEYHDAVKREVEREQRAFEAEEDPIRKRKKAATLVGTAFDAEFGLILVQLELLQQKTPDSEAVMSEIVNLTNHCLAITQEHIDQLQLNSGKKDCNGILRKEVGEAPKALMSVVQALRMGPKGANVAMAMLYQGRYEQIGFAIEEMQEIGDVILEIVKTNTEIPRIGRVADLLEEVRRHTHIDEGHTLGEQLVKNLVKTAQRRVHVAKSDDDYDTISEDLDVAQTRLRLFAQALQQSAAAKTKIAGNHLLRGMEEINKMIDYRMARPNHVNGFIAVREIISIGGVIEGLLGTSHALPDTEDKVRRFVEAAIDVVRERFRDNRFHRYSQEDPEFSPAVQERYAKAAGELSELRNSPYIPEVLRNNEHSPLMKALNLVNEAVGAVNAIHMQIKIGVNVGTKGGAPLLETTRRCRKEILVAAQEVITRNVEFQSRKI